MQLSQKPLQLPMPNLSQYTTSDQKYRAVQKATRNPRLAESSFMQPQSKATCYTVHEDNDHVEHNGGYLDNTSVKTSTLSSSRSALNPFMQSTLSQYD